MSLPISLRLDTESSFGKDKRKLNKKNLYAVSRMKVLISKYKESTLSKMINSKNEDEENNSTNVVSEGVTTDYSEIVEGKRNKYKVTFNKANNNFNNYKNNSPYPKSNYTKYKLNSRNLKSFNDNDDDFLSIFKSKKEESSDDKKAKLNDVKYLKKYFSKYKQANSLYSILDKKAKEHVNIMKEYIHRNLYDKPTKIAFGLSPFPNIGMNKDFRIKEPINKNVTLHNKNFSNRAICERYDKHMTELLRLKQLMKTIDLMDKTQKGDYDYRILCNYLAQNGIFEKKYYNKFYLKNFKEFLKINFDINPNVPYKTCLFDILKGDYDQYVENPMDSNNDSILYSPLSNMNRNNISKSFSNTIDNNLNLQNNYFIRSSINDIKCEDTKKYMDTLQSSTTLSFDKLDNFEEIKKRGKLLEFICYNKQKRKNMLNNCLKRIENIDSKLEN
jgi:hypothetical protein